MTLRLALSVALAYVLVGVVLANILEYWGCQSMSQPGRPRLRNFTAGQFGFVVALWPVTLCIVAYAALVRRGPK